MIASLAALFAATFLAATIVPFSSEVVFTTMQITGVASVVTLVLVASAGNTLGAFVNYWIGARLEDHGAHRWLRIDDRKFARAQGWWQRWGVWTLLLSWAPLLGLFTVVAGAMRTPLWQFTLFVTIAKTGRFVALGWITAQAMGLDWTGRAP
jgi:membrane protein YqaA with SNARE-associated domain